MRHGERLKIILIMESELSIDREVANTHIKNRVLESSKNRVLNFHCKKEGAKIAIRLNLVDGAENSTGSNNLLVE